MQPYITDGRQSRKSYKLNTLLLQIIIALIPPQYVQYNRRRYSFKLITNELHTLLIYHAS